MLKRFSVEGFKNFENKVAIDFSDVRDYKFNTECITNGLLSTAVIYGKNAVGKSNFGLALFDIVSHLTMNNVTPRLYDYYMNVKNGKGYAEFEYAFQFNEDEIVYRYRKKSDQTMCYEYLELNSETQFEMNDNTNIQPHWFAGFDFHNLFDLLPTLNLEQYRGGSLLKFIFYSTTMGNNNPYSKMLRFVNNMLWFRCLDENRFIGYKETSRDYFDFIFEKKEYIDEFNVLLKQSGIDEPVVGKKDADRETRLYYYDKTPIPFFKVASSGTRALYNFYYWYKTAPDVSFMYIDEFDAFYHYELSETIVGILEKMPGFQKILTSHNTNLLSNRIMRPDCYFILTKDNLTSLANATERELREGHNLEKLYMSLSQNTIRIY
ncbi:MAG: AAA family ATPase [Clostridiales bacterium]|nr:AAA family ATPase [Clostridiales bacterium]